MADLRLWLTPTLFHCLPGAALRFTSQKKGSEKGVKTPSTCGWGGWARGSLHYSSRTSSSPPGPRSDPPRQWLPSPGGCTPAPEQGRETVTRGPRPLSPHTPHLSRDQPRGMWGSGWCPRPCTLCVVCRIGWSSCVLGHGAGQGARPASGGADNPTDRH